LQEDLQYGVITRIASSFGEELLVLVQPQPGSYLVLPRGRGLPRSW
jgi:hypothetical protein